MSEAAPIPLSGADIGDAEIEAVTEVMRSGRLSLGPRQEVFERDFAAYVGTEQAVATSSGTAALHVALLALGIGPGDEVVTTSFSFIASANSILYVGARPVFVDVDEESLNLDPARVEAAITPRTRAILVVHVFGRPADMGALRAIAQRHDLMLIEDACEAIGAEVSGRRVGSLADVATFGFYPNKVITTGEGGMLTTSDPEIAAAARRLRNQGRDPGSPWLEHRELGYNYRLSELACALGAVQLSRIEEFLAARERIARAYHELLSNDDRLVLPPPDQSGDRIAWFVYVLRLAPRYSRAARDELVAALSAEGVACGRYFPPIHLQPSYRSLADPPPSLPVTEAAGDRVIALPFFNRLTADQVDRVTEALVRLIP